MFVQSFVGPHAALSYAAVCVEKELPARPPISASRPRPAFLARCVATPLHSLSRQALPAAPPPCASKWYTNTAAAMRRPPRRRAPRREQVPAASTTSRRSSTKKSASSATTNRYAASASTSVMHRWSDPPTDRPRGLHSYTTHHTTGHSTPRVRRPARATRACFTAPVTKPCTPGATSCLHRRGSSSAAFDGVTASQKVLAFHWH